jgi:hypothetical protein
MGSTDRAEPRRGYAESVLAYGEELPKANRRPWNSWRWGGTRFVLIPQHPLGSACSLGSNGRIG